MGRHQGGRVPREEKIQRKNEAGVILSHPLVIEFFEKAEEQVFTRWKQAETSADREQLWLTKLGLEAFHKFFHDLILDGKMAERDLQDQGKLSID
jgi:hypothetical protein